MSLKGKRILITAGPTIEPLDPVRYISNHSSGKQGYAIAKACIDAGADEVVLVSGPVALSAPDGVDVVRVQTAQDMFTACEMALPVDMAICVAAVCDWRPVAKASQKMKKQQGQETLTIEFERNPDILALLSSHAQRPHMVVGFAAETEDHITHAKAKLISKGCDYIVVNDVSEKSSTFGGSKTQLMLLNKTSNTAIDFGILSKEDASKKLLQFLSP